MSKFTNTTAASNLIDILHPSRPLPPDETMIETAFEILNQCPHGQQLAEFASKSGVKIKIISTVQPATYLPEPKLAYIGFNKTAPVSPGRFILMVVGILREAMQEAAGIKNPPLQAPEQEHLKVSLAKHEDKVWHMCAVACELDELGSFLEYKFLDELRKMGHNESLALFLQQERKS